MPVIITPTAFLPAYLAAERNSTSTEGRCLHTRGPSLTSTQYRAPLRFRSRWRLPGAIRAWPEITESLFSASLTVTRHVLLRRFAKALVKCSGMCWTITTPGASYGRASRKTFKASVPPVEAPTTITRSVVSVSKLLEGFAITASADSFGTALKGFFLKRFSFAWDAAFTASHIHILDSSRNLFVPRRGLWIISIAPYSRAFTAVSEPVPVWLEHTTTGRGFCCMIF